MRHLWRGLAAFLLLLAPAAAHAEERILRYLQRRPGPEGLSIEVAETIDVHAEHDRINHGIYRDFPTRYRGPQRHPVPCRLHLRGRDARRQPGQGVGRAVRQRRPHQARRSGQATSTSASTDYVIRYRATRADRPLRGLRRALLERHRQRLDLPDRRRRGPDPPARARQFRRSAPSTPARRARPRTTPKSSTRSRATSPSGRPSRSAPMKG